MNSAQNIINKDSTQDRENKMGTQLLEVGQLAVGMEVDAPNGPAEITGIEDSRWRFSLKPKRRITFRDLASGACYGRSYFTDAPLHNNPETHHANDPGSQRGYSTEQYQALMLGGTS